MKGTLKVDITNIKSDRTLKFWRAKEENVEDCSVFCRNGENHFIETCTMFDF